MATTSQVAHPSTEERKALGKESRSSAAPPSAHAGWRPAPNRPDPVSLLEEQNKTRVV